MFPLLPGFFIQIILGFICHNFGGGHNFRWIRNRFFDRFLPLFFDGLWLRFGNRFRNNGFQNRFRPGNCQILRLYFYSGIIRLGLHFESQLALQLINLCLFIKKFPFFFLKGFFFQSKIFQGLSFLFKFKLLSPFPFLLFLKCNLLFLFSEKILLFLSFHFFELFQ